MRARKLLLCAMTAAMTLTVSAQSYDVDIKYIPCKNYKAWKKGQPVHIVKVSHETVLPSSEDNNTYNAKEVYYIFEEGIKTPHPVQGKFGDVMICNSQGVQTMWDAGIIRNVLPMLGRKGYQIPLRQELDDDAKDFIYRLNADGRKFNDPLLESYIYSILAKVKPRRLIDGRTVNVNIQIVNDETENAFTFANGTIVLTTGLLAALHTEDELAAILARETAHYVLDHSVANVNAAISRQKRAEFWTAMATTAVATGEMIASSKDEDYIPGFATIATSIISASIAESYLREQGIRYTNKQEDEADNMALVILPAVGYDRDALSTALSRLHRIYKEERRPSAYFPTYSDRDFSDRMSTLGTPYSRTDTRYEQMVSFAVSSAAMRMTQLGKFSKSLDMVGQNIKNGVATADDYLVKANSLLALNADTASADEALDALQMAKVKRPSDMDHYRPQVTALLRLGRTGDALDVLADYKTALGDAKERLTTLQGENRWQTAYTFLNDETRWAEDMTAKVGSMK
ncbi:MAG: M48 family metallopeptidase [Prevotella sp.]